MRSQNRLALVSFSLAVLLSQVGLIPVASAIPNPIDNGRGRKSDLPTAPSTPPPSGNRQPGGSLGGPSVCPQKAQPLTAITPENVHGKTMADAPTFWFYMPYTAAEVPGGEFSILTWDEEQYIYETAFTLPDQPGFVSITLPAAEAASLQAGQYYHWYLNLHCASTAEAKTTLNIDGWIERIAATPEREQQIVSPDIWYDAIDYLAGQLQTASTDGLGQLWTYLLESVELDELTQEPVVGPVLIDG